MMKCENIDLMRKIKESNKNCGVKLRSKSESDHLITERLEQLQVEGKIDTLEYRFLSAIQARNCE